MLFFPTKMHIQFVEWGQKGSEGRPADGGQKGRGGQKGGNGVGGNGGGRPKSKGNGGEAS